MPRRKDVKGKSNTPTKKIQMQEILKCGTDASYFINNYIKIPHPIRGMIPFNTFPFQDECLNAFQNNKNVIVNKSRQLGLSTIVAAYALWMALFQKEKNILVIAIKLDTAKLFIKKVEAMLFGLPSWLVMPKIRAQSVKYLVFSNGSKIQAIPTSAGAGRGEALSLLIVDEAAHVEGIDEIWLGLQPTLSCVTGDTLVLTDNGFIRIEDFHKNRKIGDYFNLEINVYGKNGLEKTSHGYVSPENETLIVTTRHGAKVEVTPIHPLYSLQNNGFGKMVQAQNLRINDLLRIEYGQNIFGKVNLDKQVAYMLGGFIAEGWITKRLQKDGTYKFDSIEIENTDTDFRQVFLSENNLTKKFAVVPSRITRLRCSSRELIKEWQMLGINPLSYCYNKTTPNSILQGTKNTVTNYLSGLFDGDGSVTENGVVLSSTSEELIRETGLLLRNLGFIINIHHVLARSSDLGRVLPQGKPLQSLRDSWRLIVPRSQYNKFAQEIGFRIKRKQNKLVKLSKKYNQVERRLTTIPVNNISQNIKSLFTKSKKTKEWFRQQGLRIDKCLDGKPNRTVTQEWLLKFKLILEQIINLSNEEQEFFNENTGSFFWDEIVKIEKSFNKTYDFTVPKTHSFLQNGILGSNTGGAAILISTPSGVGTLFHKIWVSAQEERSDFASIELPWTVHPERDQEWFEEQRRAIFEAQGERGVAQELLCSFAASGDTFLRNDVMERLFSDIREPIAFWGPEDMVKKDLWIWAHPKTEHRYLIGADIARGDGDDFSTFHVIDTDDDEVVAEFKGKVAPDKLAEILVTVARRYNMAMICPEKNSVGVGCCLKLKELNYQNLYYDKLHKNLYMVYSTMDTANELPGFETGQKNRVEILARLEDVLRNKRLKTYSKRLYEELQTFVWKGNKPMAQKGYHDDLVMALAIGNSLFEANGTNTYSDDDMAKAMIAGMSVSFNSVDNNASSNNSTMPPIVTGGSLSNFLDQTKAKSLTHSKTQNYNDPFWRQWDWVYKS